MTLMNPGENEIEPNPLTPRRIVSGLPIDLRALALEIHADNIRAGWWKQTSGVTIRRNIGELLCLVHSEISEADEGRLGDLRDDKVPHRPMVEVELADTAIRVLDILGYYGDHVIGRSPLPLPSAAYWEPWICLMHRTVSAAMEGFRKGNRWHGCDALVDLLGILHFAAISFELDLSGAIAEKRTYNATRLDHQLSERAKPGGKAF